MRNRFENWILDLYARAYEVGWNHQFVGDTGVETTLRGGVVAWFYRQLRRGTGAVLWVLDLHYR